MSSRTFRFDPWGDLTLKVGPDDAMENYIVCPRTLARSSPVFDRMLYGDFAEASLTTKEAVGGWVVRLPEDKPVIMGLFLSIIHGNYDEALQTLSLDEIYDLTVVAHYYDATKVLRPWVKVWIDYIARIAECTSTPMLKVLWVAWEFGALSVFQMVSRCILLEFDAADFTDALSCGGTQTPPGAIEHIYLVRERILFSLLHPLKDLINHLLVEDEKPRWCRHAVWMGPHRCESIILGSLTFSLYRAKLWPLPEASSASDSIVEIYTHLSNLTIHDLGKAEKTKDHIICNPSELVRSHIQAAMKHVTVQLTDKQREYMEKQKCALGLNVGRSTVPLVETSLPRSSGTG